MNKDIKILGYQLMCNSDVELHSDLEIQNLIKGKVLEQSDLENNKKV